MSPIIWGFLIAVPFVLIILSIVMWVLSRYDKKLDSIKIEEEVKNKIINDKDERSKINDEIFQMLDRHRKYEKIFIPTLFIWGAIAIIIIFVSDIGYIKTIAGESFAAFLIINFIFVSKWRGPKIRYISEIIKLEEEIEERILIEKNHNLLILGLKERREKIQFKDE